MENFHKSVLAKEVLEGLSVVAGEDYLDATLGGGGHTEEIIKFGGRVTALDVDDDAIENAKKKFDLKQRDGVWVTKSENLKVFKENFKNLDQVEPGLVFSGILFDLGVSSFMLDTPEKGFSFSKSGKLDMRMDQDLAVTAADLLNGLNEGELYELFSKLGEEPYARRIARDVVRTRIEKKFEDTLELAELIEKIYYGKKRREIHPATRSFMALRLAVNDELNNLKEALPKAKERLRKGGRLLVISFHSLEDKIVKDFFKQAKDLRQLTEKPVIAEKNEIENNPRSRSAKMRVAEKI